jgi:hypothetical protein
MLTYFIVLRTQESGRLEKTGDSCIKFFSGQLPEHRKDKRERPMPNENTIRATQRTAHARSLLILLENANLELIDSAAIQDVIGAAGRLLDEALAQVGGHTRIASEAGPYHSRGR